MEIFTTFKAYSSPSSLGTADMGQASHASITGTNSSSCYVSAANGLGIWHHAASGGPLSANVIDVSWGIPGDTVAGGPWGQNDIWTMYTDFIVTSSGIPNGRFDWAVQNNADAYSFYVYVDLSTNTIYDTNGNSTAFTVSPNTRYQVRWEIDYTGGVSNFKVWEDGTPEPDWLIASSALVDFTKDTTSQFELNSANYSTTDTFQLNFGSILFASGGGCPPPSSGMLVPLQQIGTGDGSTTTFSTTSAYVSGTLRVVVDNLDETDAIASADPATGSFTLSFAPAAASGSTPAEVVYASWTAA
jgi:hypothetical protein